jgi:hypothetical protein
MILGITPNSRNPGGKSGKIAGIPIIQRRNSGELNDAYQLYNFKKSKLRPDVQVTSYQLASMK